MKNIYSILKNFSVCILILSMSQAVFSQAVTVNTSTYTAAQLVNTVFGGGTQLPTTNISKSSGNGVGYFQNTNSSFPLNSGIVIATGNVSSIASNATLSGIGSNVTDADLHAVSVANGLSGNIVDTSFLSFDFTSVSTNLSFNYIFASEEYGAYQCGFTDQVAFILTNLSTGVKTNLALIPNTTIPVSVTNIRNNLYNSACVSNNSQFFGFYDVSNNATLNGTCFNGRTVLMNASATLVPNTPYRLKIVIGDYQDALFDSAVFLQANSLNVGQDSGVLGPDLSIANNTALCPGSSALLSTGAAIPNAVYSWYYNGTIITGATGPTFLCNFPGEYKVVYGVAPNYFQDSIIVESANVIEPLPDIIACDYYTLPFLQYDGEYLTNPNGGGVLIAPGTIITSNVTIYVDYPNGNCPIYDSFTITINEPPVVPSTVSDYVIYETNPTNFAVFNLNSKIPEMLVNQSPTDFQVSFYHTLQEATTQTNPIFDPANYTNTSNPETIYAIVSALNTNCVSSVVSFQLSVAPMLSTTNVEASSFNLSPNPVTDILSIDSKLEIKKVEVYTVLGQKVFQLLEKSFHPKMDLSNLNLGSYFIKITSNSGLQTFKIVKK